MKTAINFFSWARPVRSKSRHRVGTADAPQARRTSNGVWIIPLRAALVFGMLSVALLAHADTTYDNPINAKSFPDLITSIAKAVQDIGTVLAVAAIVFVGVRFVIAAASGDTGALTKARTMLWYVLIGTVIVVGASYLAQVAVSIVKNLPK